MMTHLTSEVTTNQFINFTHQIIYKRLYWVGLNNVWCCPGGFDEADGNMGKTGTANPRLPGPSPDMILDLTFF